MLNNSILLILVSVFLIIIKDQANGQGVEGKSINQISSHRLDFNLLLIIIKCCLSGQSKCSIQ